LIKILAVPSAAYYAVESTSELPKDKPFVGVSFGGNTTEQAKVLIDRVKNFTNLFVIQAGVTQHNQTLMTEICDYAVASGLNIIVYFGWLEPTQPWQFPWILNAKEQYGSHFLGVYYYDEPGGIQLDYNWERLFNVSRHLGNIFYRNTTEALQGYTDETKRNYDSAAQIFLSYQKEPSNITNLQKNGVSVSTSDYALYWFDYKMGYNTIFTELFANQSVTQSIDLVRGAAHMQNKTWGAILTWSGSERGVPSDPNGPALANATEMLSQMKTVYAAGAKYIIIFDYPYLNGNPYGILSSDQLNAMQSFWLYMQSNPRLFDSIRVDIAMVMPKNYGFGLRNAQDGVWFWGPDNRSASIYNLAQSLIAKYGLSMDIVYNDTQFPLQKNYTNVFWCESNP
jgi:hypothetical protein